MEAGLRIKDARIKKQVSQAQLAKKIKTLNQSQICKIEKGKRAIKVDELSDIANALEIPITQILT